MTATSSYALVSTDRPGRYGKQLASHFSQKIDTSWDEEAGRGQLIFRGLGKDSEDPRRAFDGQGTVTLQAVPDDSVLRLDVEVTHPELLGRFQQVVASHLVRFGSKEGLEVTWQE